MEADSRNRVAFPRRWWYPVCRSSDLARRPLAVTVMDAPLVMYRDRTGRPRALVDRCPHRNMALSLGRVQPDGSLQCAYHGWRFDTAGRCTLVPGLDRLPSSPGRDVPSHPAREQDGFVWVWAAAGEPRDAPFALPRLAGPRTGRVVFERDLDCTLHAAVENTLDVPHTAFLHGGLFRGGRSHPVTAVRADRPDGVEVRYLGEPVAYGRLRLPGGGITFDHWDRFFLPSIAQVEYRVKDWLQIVTTVVHLPVSAFRTRAWFVVDFRGMVPAAVVRPVVRARGRRILEQDALALAEQHANISRFGGERYTSTDLDLVGNAVWRLLREAERAESTPGGPGRPDPAGGPGHDDHPAGDDGAGRPSVTFRI